MRSSSILHVQYLPTPLNLVAPFLGRAENHARILPPRLQVRRQDRAAAESLAAPQVLISTTWWGLPIRWHLVSTLDSPFEAFCYEQVRGPWIRWSHHCSFESIEGGTRIVDRIRFTTILGRILARVFLRKRIESILAYRAQRLFELFNECEPHPFDGRLLDSAHGLEQA